jgi:hypothetical protein
VLRPLMSGRPLFVSTNPSVCGKEHAVHLPHRQQGPLALAMTAVAMPMAEVQALTDLTQINRLLQAAILPTLYLPLAPLTFALSTTGQPTRARRWSRI